ncbi:tRNA (adenosine(37)-N6)-threonylcarbamoyltransferase complex dimerization subunit type 1 TsaB [Serinicoccus kebangsaanensis]|uniref:tRNA (adenosine(37)-N6)-threonylcarbamoyltransferase complex dimerization subunit type 1 TsaB n=1 Tax=Serinicoccus kebangsaanensis TaxID=2602069 RepID=UPI00124F72EB|nr:tRNA (adenosine(37)-N6)-threonylcarbamoyltransferase complex dimerization subunit type 1 TsaB [Serinicoccus kebangsaanensis]
MLLAIDTATGIVGAALHDGERVRAEVVHHDVRRHGELLAPAIQEALREAGIPAAELTAVVCGVGPGPFTGLRVGVVTALTLAHGLGLPTPQGICSLDALAHQVMGTHEGELLVATDARRREVYWAHYAVGPTDARRIAGPGVCADADLAEQLRTLPTVGRGAELYPDAFSGVALPDVRDVRPGALAELAVRLRAGDHPDAETALLPPEPLYLRRPDAVEMRR